MKKYLWIWVTLGIAAAIVVAEVLLSIMAHKINQL